MEPTMVKESNKKNLLMDSYLELDKGERVPLDLSVKLLLSKDCRKQIKMLRIAEKASSETFSVPVSVNDSTIEAVMARIAPDYKQQAEKNPISMIKWILGGLVIILTTVFFSMLTKTVSNYKVSIAYYLMVAIAVIIYASMFVLSNMDFFIKRINIVRINKKASSLKD